MLKAEDNEILTRVGPGTLMGNLLRRYWTPACLTAEIPEPGSPPARVRLLGENLVAFRDTRGRVGLVQENCPHRGASLYFGRNEDAAIRCVYHGWAFDVDGRCVDMPQDYMVTESMGPIYDRTQEHLGSTDKAITRMRHILISAAKGLAEGKEPPAVGDHDYRSIFGAEKILAPGEDWRTLATPDDPTFAEALDQANGQLTNGQPTS